MLVAINSMTPVVTITPHSSFDLKIDMISSKRKAVANSLATNKSSSANDENLKKIMKEVSKIDLSEIEEEEEIDGIQLSELEDIGISYKKNNEHDLT